MSYPLGEFPPLPPDFVAAMRARARQGFQALADRTWDFIADSAVVMFEGSRRS